MNGLSNTSLKLFKKMNGRYFEGRQIEAALYTGRQRFRKSGTEGHNLEGGDDDEKRRLDDFTKWLMAEED
jgi:HIV Tat-specific factor 1